MNSGTQSDSAERARSQTDAQTDGETGDPHLLDSLAGLNTAASVAVAQRTRRAVRDAVLSAMQVRRTRRRNAGIATVVALALLVLLSPALWSVIDELFRGEYLSDLTPMVTLLVVLVLSGMLAALVAGLKNQDPARQGRRNV